MPAADTRPPRLLYLVTEDWFFASHFLGFARAARAAGLEPVVATRVRDHRAVLEAAGLRVASLESERGSLAPGALVDTVRRYRAAIAAERPAILHAIALRTVVLGGLAARRERVPSLVLAPTGLGHLWVSSKPAARLARLVTRAVVPGLLDRPGTRFLFENGDDPKELGLAGSPRLAFVGGAGVSATRFHPSPEPAAGPIRVAVVARMLTSKGIPEAVEAVRLARAAGCDVVLDLWGAPDPSNPDTLDAAALARLTAGEGVVWHGPTDDVPGVWRRSHVALLLSHREGFPRSLVEAAASGRPIVATDVPGCRAVVADGVEGLLVSSGDPAAAARAIARLAADPALRVRLGAAARARFERDMSEAVVEAAVADLYRACLAEAAGA
jgi:hypothetical protein